MRLLHTSDWHLGRSLLSAPMLEHQRAFLAWLGEQAREHDVAAILVSGDVYDRAVPAVEAVTLLEDALIDLAASCPVVLVPGNHDSAARLGFGGRLLETANVHLRSTVADLDRPIVLSDHEVSVAVYGVPFLEPQRVCESLDAARSHAAVLAAAMGRIRSDLAARQSGPTDPPLRTVVLAHAFVTGGASSDSERDLTVGGVPDAPVSVFDGIDYVALGHLHRPQTIERPDGIARYSGSPLPYSFSEESHAKSVTLVHVTPTTMDVEELPAPVPRRLRTITGDLDEVLADPHLTAAESDWIRVILTDPTRPEFAMDRLRARFPYTLELTWQPHLDGAPVLVPEVRIDPGRSAPSEVLDGFIEHVTGLPPTPSERQLARDAIERQARTEADA